MSKGRKADVWYKMYAEKFLWGTLKGELEVDERAVWIDFLCLAAMFSGKVDITYKKKLASMLIIPLELLERSIKKFEKTKRIKISSNKKESKTYATILKWTLYQSDFLGGTGNKKPEISDAQKHPRGTMRISGLEEKRLEESRREEKRGGEKTKNAPKKSKLISFEIQNKIAELKDSISYYKGTLENPEVEGWKKTNSEEKLKTAEEELRQLKKIIEEEF